MEAAAWIGPRLHPFRDARTGSVVPTGFEAYVRSESLIELVDVLQKSRVRLPGRDYLLFTGPVEQGGGWDDGPNLWWPDDHAWCVASEIDVDHTLVGGSAALRDSLLDIGAEEVPPESRN